MFFVFIVAGSVLGDGSVFGAALNHEARAVAVIHDDVREKAAQRV